MHGSASDLTLDVNLARQSFTPNTINIESYEKESAFTLTNSGNWVGIVDLSGDKKLNINLGNMNGNRGVTVDATKMTARLTLNASANNGLTFFRF